MRRRGEGRCWVSSSARRIERDRTGVGTYGLMLGSQLSRLVKRRVRGGRGEEREGVPSLRGG